MSFHLLLKRIHPSSTSKLAGWSTCTPCRTTLNNVVKAALAPRTAIVTPTKRFFSSESITYSGGQATEGQGGYYGSGGARKLQPSPSSSVTSRSQMLALAADVTNITNTMNEVETLESLLMEENNNNGSDITGKMIEIKSKIKKACINPEFMDSLNRLELNGEPIWGLSGDERDMIMDARAKVNAC